ncbi:putative receptor-like serine/threonine-protein kinase [Heracleum sosnowskyi]|uniref:Receptor-like serine/threonine-protein kinase n=1 Tax=Heracleum sosnowskyi TaxID=360622 RepID=A0AAD8H851_9APIA|nr:putative receptor-like serine/threonine-protein kinase [Heracleum sosnowskyi]
MTGNDDGVAGECSSRTVMVGVKMDSQSRELLTWALVKVAQSGDHVVALHVLNDNVNVDRSLLSLVKEFDAILSVYEGFCNLKQVDLKLKICRGSSVRKILVREAKSYFATEVIVGTSQKQHKLRSSVSVAKYCARKLSKHCSVVAVNNGKIAFQKEASSKYTFGAKGTEEHRRNNILCSLQKSSSEECRIGNECKHNSSAHSELALIKFGFDFKESTTKKDACSICSRYSLLLENACEQKVEKSDADDNSMAIVPVQKLEGASNSKVLLMRKLPELRPGWSLHRRAISSYQEAFDSPSVKQISVNKNCLSVSSSDASQGCHHYNHVQSPELNGETGAIVPVDKDMWSPPSSPSSTRRSLPEELEGLHEMYSATCRLFQYEELVLATSKFKPENMIGKGGNSQVYRGRLPDGKELAVKILKHSEDVLKEFVMEIEIITALHHKNIISLFGFCFEENNLLLVYDFLSRGSLEENLHGNRMDPLTFGLPERYKVALGVAEALEYLHSTSSKPVIHRDVKSSNILLSDDFEPQLSDFGLATWASTTSSHITCTDVAGTFGYLAPEYFMYGKVNDKIDVFAFGVVLLELLSGKKPISNEYPKGQESLVMWARPVLNGGKFAQILDPSLGSAYDCDLMERMTLAATLCIRRSPRARPHMSLVVKLLQGDVEVVNWARLQVNTLDGSGRILEANTLEETDTYEEEGISHVNLQNYLNLALLDIEESSASPSSTEQSISIEDYLQDRWSRSSSFD